MLVGGHFHTQHLVETKAHHFASGSKVSGRCGSRKKYKETKEMHKHTTTRPRIHDGPEGLEKQQYHKQVGTKTL